MRRLAFLIALTTIVLAGTSVNADPIQDYYDEMRGYFKNSHWIPIIIPRGEQIGNVYDIRNLQFVADYKTCFPKLSIPAPQNTALPALVSGKNINGALALGVKNIAAAQTELGTSSGVTVQFIEPRVVTIPALTLASFYNPQQCKFLAQQIDATRSGIPMTGSTTYLVIGEVLVAKRHVTFAYSDSAKANAELSSWQRLLQATGLSASVHIAADSNRSVVVIADNPVAIAIRPAFVPDKFPGVQLGLNANEDILWSPLTAFPNQLRQIDDLAEKIGENLPSADELKDF